LVRVAQFGVPSVFGDCRTSGERHILKSSIGHLCSTWNEHIAFTGSQATDN